MSGLSEGQMGLFSDLTACPCGRCCEMRALLAQCGREHAAQMDALEDLDEALAEFRRVGGRAYDLAGAISKHWPDASEVAEYLCVTRDSSTRPTKIYLMQALPSGALKVGYSTNPYRRRGELRQGLLHDTDLVLLATRDGGPAEEQELLDEIAGLGIAPINGKREWFEQDERILNAFGVRP